MSSQEYINIGAMPNDGQGDPLRVAFSKINNNFSNLFSTYVNLSNTYTNGNTPGQVIFFYPADNFTQAQFWIQSSNPNTQDSQTIELYAQISNDKTMVKFTGYGSTFFGNALSSFDMTVNNGYVQILANPLVNNTTAVLHFIGSQVMWLGPVVAGKYIALDGYDNSVLATETLNPITTEY
jgi:hypothetical protein